LLRQCYLAYPIVHAVRAQSGWTHYRALLRLPDPAQRECYGRLAATGRWSSRALDRQIGACLFARVGRSRQAGDLAATLPAPAAADRARAPADVCKGPSILDFLGLEDTYAERDLVAAILRTSARSLWNWGLISASSPASGWSAGRSAGARRAPSTSSPSARCIPAGGGPSPPTRWPSWRPRPTRSPT